MCEQNCALAAKGMDMTTPITDFVKNYIRSDAERLHMPGHKGKELLGFERYDITEIDGADVLYHADGIIKESMENAASLFGTAKTVYSTEGSSLSIRAMLYLTVLYAKTHGHSPLIFAGRNAHKVFVMSAALLDFRIKWLYGNTENGITECMISPEELEKELCETEEKPCAVYITSPDYLGNIADIAGLSAVCRKYGVLLLADNAHGAYLNFLPQNMHPIALGADICCDSAHKTLPALTGAGYLHISKSAPVQMCENAEKAMTLFASTSPSYLILQSLDEVNRYLCEGYRERLAEYCTEVSRLKKRLLDIGIYNRDLEELKITVMPKRFGYTGDELYRYLCDNGMVCEFYDPDNVVMMLTPENGSDILDVIYDVFSKLSKRTAIDIRPPSFAKPHMAISIKEAMFSVTERLPVEKCLGRVFAGINAACPPAIPVAVCGEIVDESVTEMLRYYGQTECDVLV